MSGDEVPDRRALRASHEDRDQVVEQLRVAAGDGRLTAEELDERLGVALTARTYGELAPLLADLPAAPGPAAPVPAPVLAAKEHVTLQSHSGSVKRDGPWVVPRRLEVDARSGSTSLDFTQAVVSHSTLDITVSMWASSLTLIVPPGAVVDTDGVALHSATIRHREVRGPGTSVKLLINVSGEIKQSSVSIRGPRRPRRTFWAWLLRRPRPTASIGP